MFNMPRFDSDQQLLSQGEHDGRGTKEAEVPCHVEAKRVSEKGMFASVVTTAVLENS